MYALYQKTDRKKRYLVFSPVSLTLLSYRGMSLILIYNIIDTPE